MAPTASTSGSARSRSRRRRVYTRASSGVNRFARVRRSAGRPARGRCPDRPTAPAEKPRRNRPAPTSSTSEIVSCATTRALRHRSCPGWPPPAPSLRRAQVTSRRVLCSAATRPSKAPATTETPSVNARPQVPCSRGARLLQRARLRGDRAAARHRTRSRCRAPAPRQAAASAHVALASRAQRPDAAPRSIGAHDRPCGRQPRERVRSEPLASLARTSGKGWDTPKRRNPPDRIRQGGRGAPPVPLVPNEPSMVHSTLPPTWQLDVGRLRRVQTLLHRRDGKHRDWTS